MKRKTKAHSSPKSLSELVIQRVLLISLIAIVGLGSTIVLSSWVTLLRVQSRIDDISVEAARTFDMFFLDIRSDLSATSDGLTIHPDVDLALLQLRARNQSFLDVLFVNLDGTVLAQRSALGRPQRAVIEQQSWLLNPPAFGGAYIGPVEFEGQAPYVDMAVTATDDIGLPAGLLWVRVDLTALWNTMLDIDVGKTGYAYIADNTGQLVAYRNRRLLETGSNLVDLVGRTPQAIEASPMNWYTGLNGQLVLASAQPLKVVPWFALVEQPMREALTPALLPIIIVLVILALGGLVFYDVIKFTRVRIVLPLLSLQEVVGQIKDKPPDQKIVVEYEDELGQLARGFNRMSDQLRQAFETLEKANAELQQEMIERRRTEEELAKERLLLRTVIDNVPDAIYAKDLQGRKTFANRADLDNIGVEMEEEVLGKSDYDIFPPDIAARFDTNDQIVFQTGQPVLNEEEFLTNDKGKQIWLLSSKLPLKDPAGQIIGLVGIGRDTTAIRRASMERERLVKRIQESEQRIRQIIDTVPEGVLLLDAELNILLKNPPADEYLSRLIGEEVQTSSRKLTHLGGRPIAELLTSPPQGLWHEVTVNRLHFQVIARAVETGPAMGGWVFVIRDVTEEYEAQQSVQRQERLAVVGQLAAGIAHDFNNILAGIVLYSQMSLRMPDISPILRERLTIIADQGRRASDLINQILDFSRRAVLDRQPLDLTPLLKEQVKFWERTLPENIRLDFTWGPDVYVVNADPTRIQQVFMNLVVNARDAMPEGGELYIDLTRIYIADTKSAPLPGMSVGEWVRVAVTDTGIGIPGDVLPHIYDPFFTTKEPGKGTGLGLAQVYGIVSSHEGRINVNTQIGVGTTFTIYLPALPLPDSPAVSVIDAHLPLGHGETILVVEDNATTRAAVISGLELLNYRTLEASHGKEALDLFTRHHQEIALVLSDLVMPEMGGKALAEALYAREPTVRIVVMSGHPLNTEIDSLHEAGITDWLQKPPSLEQLAETLAKAMI